MPVDLKSGNTIANTVSQNLQSIDKTLDVANSGSAQAANIAAINSAVLGNADLVDSIGANGVQTLTADFANLTNDMLGAGAATGDRAAAFQADMTKLTQDLNNAGVQFDTSNGQGHYDASTLAPSAFASAGPSNAQMSPTQSMGSGSSSSNVAGTVLAELNTVISGVDTSPSALATSLPKMASEIRGIVAQNQLPAEQQAKLQTFSNAVDAAVASYNPNNPQGSLRLIDTAVQDAFAKTGLTQAASAGAGMTSANPNPITLSAQHALQDIGQKVYQELLKNYSVIDDSTPATLQTSLTHFSDLVTNMANDSSLPADTQTKLKTYAGVIAEQAATIDPANFSASESAAKSAMDKSFFSLGFRQDAGLASAGQDTVKSTIMDQLADFALSASPLVQNLSSASPITADDAKNFYKQIESLLVNTPTPTLEARTHIEKAMTAINQAAATYATAGTSTSGAQAFLTSVRSALSFSNT